MICWVLWNNINNLVQNQRGGEVTEVLAPASAVLDHPVIAQIKEFDRQLSFMTQEDGNEHWTTPNIGKVKVNSTAAIFEDFNCYSFAIVARNYREKLIEATSRCVPGKVSADMTEIMGIGVGLGEEAAQAEVYG